MLHRNTSPLMVRLGTLIGLAAAAFGCAAGEPFGGTCETGADCESGACKDQVCVAPEGTGGSGGEGAAGGGSTGGAGGEGAAGASGGSGAQGGGGGLCSPNEDGTITREEVPLEPGLDAKFRIATNVTFSTAGTTEGGETTWDLSTMLTGDHASLVETLPLPGTWFEEVFPGASYAVRLTDTETLLGVFEITDEALLLRGIVSPEDGVTRTELTYDPPIEVLSFPLVEGKTWTTDSTVTGYTSGVFSAYSETYENVVDARGTIVTPFSTFDGFRVRVDLTRLVGALLTTQKTFAFVTECFGTVATINSELNETSDEFDDVSEIRRLTP